MIYKNAFIDSDVLLDLLLMREPFFTFSQTLLAKSKNKTIKISTSSLVIANIHYILARNIGKELARDSVRSLINNLNVLPFDIDAINLAVNSEFTDFEDAIQYYIAQKFQCDAIISRNLKHYKKSHLPVLTTEQFLRTL
ncbi:type II toxin-antitoxin system VapC family toxin [Mucilaginibacter paludis]|uniref:PilT protein domain protein n=1 Tax=Mucilaginibacter paludis DSM 18603 TaxID=714943 RepID=H1YGM6_9SPHI|nr:PIN domain-containing protein [Mucilaginibacter paludis]EHQ25412.1 PilT protein domain protein [Mucilaginibacter paludis DSM 18603]